MEVQSRFTIHLEQRQNYEFNVKFDWDEASDLFMDEPLPLGHQNGPNASRLLAAAVGNCLCASLLFCLKKNNASAQSIKAQVTGVLARNAKQRLRIHGMEVQITLDTESFEVTRLKRCIDMFEDFCVVSASIRDGIPIAVNVLNQQGTIVHKS